MHVIALVHVAIGLLALGLMAGPAQASESTRADRGSGGTSSPMRVVVTVAPLKSLVEPLLPEGSAVTVLMPPGRSEHGFEFSPRDLAELAKADIVVYVGLNLEPKVAAALRDRPVESRRVVCFAEVVGLQRPGEPEPNTLGSAPCDDHDGHNHGADHDHDHGPAWIDQHLWLDPSMVRSLVPAVGGAVESVLKSKGEVIPEQIDLLRKREKQLAERIDAVDAAWRDGLASLKGASIVTHHDAFSRPATRYGLTIAQVIRTGEGQEPTPGDIAAVVKSIREQKVRAIFVEPQFNAKSAERIAKAANVRLGRLDPLGEGDWFAMMEANLTELKKNLSRD